MYLLILSVEKIMGCGILQYILIESTTVIILSHNEYIFEIHNLKRILWLSMSGFYSILKKNVFAFNMTLYGYVPVKLYL